MYYYCLCTHLHLTEAIVIALHILDEQRLELSQAAKLLGTEERPASLAKMSRAISRGVKAETGERVRLEALRVGAFWITSREAVQRFVARLTAAATGETDLVEMTPHASSRRRNREKARAEAEAAALGF
jgi:hypothetical protein